VADVLFGAYNPSGKLPVSWPRRIGDAPLFYTYLPGHNDAPGSGYDPLFAFGDGLGYTTFTYGQLQVMAPPARDGTLRVAVDVTNTGRRAGDEIVQVYAHPESSPVLVPPRRLIAFTRLRLAPGETRTARFQIPLLQLAVVAADLGEAGHPVVASGPYTLMVASRRATITVP
jgi:beta-glucosidase